MNRIIQTVVTTAAVLFVMAPTTFAEGTQSPPPLKSHQELMNSLPSHEEIAQDVPTPASLVDEFTSKSAEIDAKHRANYEAGVEELNLGTWTIDTSIHDKMFARIKEIEDFVAGIFSNANAPSDGQDGEADSQEKSTGKATSEETGYQPPFSEQLNLPPFPTWENLSLPQNAFNFLNFPDWFGY